MQRNFNGIVLLNKQPGLTSFNSLGAVKRAFKNQYNQKIKVGHTGTLDSFAEGLLVVLTGKFTKLNPLFTSLDKTYEAVIEFGRETDTLDPTGTVIKTAVPPSIDIINKKILNYSGKIKQRPPIFSAIHVDGERAYKRALKGTIQDLPEREVEIYYINILNWNEPFLKCEISCSKGTYIRSIARDLGHDCGSCACLHSLKRTKVGPFNVEDSVLPENFDSDKNIISGREVFERIGSIVEFGGILEVFPEYLENFQNGKEIKEISFETTPNKNGLYAVFCKDVFLALINYSKDNYSYIFVG